METSLQKIIAAIVGVMILFIIPVYIAFEKVDDVSYSLVLKLTQNFVDNARDKGYISPEMYSDFVSGIYATNNTYDVNIEHVKKRYDPAIYIYEKKENNERGRLLYILDYDKYLTEDGELPSTITINEGIYNETNSDIVVEKASITMADGSQIDFKNGGDTILTPEELYKLKIDEFKSQNRIILDKGEIYADVRKVVGNSFDEEIYNPAYITLNDGKITIENKQGSEPNTINYNSYIGNYDISSKNGSEYFNGPVYNSSNSKIVYTPATMYIDGMNLTPEQAKDFYRTWRTLYQEAVSSGDGRLVYDAGEIYADKNKVRSVGNTIDAKLDNIASISVVNGKITINADKQVDGFETELDYDKYISAYDNKEDMVAYSGEIYDEQNSSIVNTRAAMWVGNKKYDELSESEKTEAENLYESKINTDLYKNNKTIVLSKGKIFAESENAIGYNRLTDEIRNINVTGQINKNKNINALYIEELPFSEYINEYRNTGKIVYDEGGNFENGKDGISIIHVKGSIYNNNGESIDYNTYIDAMLDKSSDKITISKKAEFLSNDIYIENAKVIINGTVEKGINSIEELKEITQKGKVVIDGVEYSSVKEENPDNIQVINPTFMALQNNFTSDVQITDSLEIQNYINEYVSEGKITYEYQKEYFKNEFFVDHEAVYVNRGSENKYTFFQYLNKQRYNEIFTEDILNDIDNQNEREISIPKTVFNTEDIEVRYNQIQIDGETPIDITNETMVYVNQYFTNKRIVLEEANVAKDDEINVIHPKLEIFEKGTSISNNPVYSFKRNVESENSDYIKYLNEYTTYGRITIHPSRIYTYNDVTVTRSKITINPESEKFSFQTIDDLDENYNKYLDEFEKTGKITIKPAITYSTDSEITVQDAHISITPTGYRSPMIDIYELDNKELYDMYVNEFSNSQKVTLKYKLNDVTVYRANITIEKLAKRENTYDVSSTQIVYDNTDLNGDGTFEYPSFKAEYNSKGLITFLGSKQISAANLKVTDPSITIKDPKTGETIIKYAADYSQLTDEQRYQIYNMRSEEWEDYSQIVNKKTTYISGENCIIEKAHVVNEEIITDKQIVSKIFEDTGVSKIEFLRNCMLGNGDMYKSLSYLNENSYIMNEGDQINVIVKNRNQTVASVFYSMFTANVGNEEIPKIYVNYGGTVKNSGDTIISNKTTLVNSELGRLFKYKGQAEEVVLEEGTYQIEAWGASGGGYEATTSSTTGGKGSYAKAVFNVANGTTLYVYVGGQGSKYFETNEQNGGFNGGGNSYNGFGGGGASDVRLIKGDATDTVSLLSRIIVAGGGGGSSKAKGNNYGTGGYGGTLLTSGNGTSVGVNQLLIGKGAISSAITIGYDQYTKADGTNSKIPDTEKGNLGIGGSVDFDGAGAGGGGYFGGSAAHDEYAGGGGGLSFVYQNEVNVIGGKKLPLKAIFEGKYEQKVMNTLSESVDASTGKWKGITYVSMEVIGGNSNMRNPLQYSNVKNMDGNKGNGMVIIKKIN